MTTNAPVSLLGLDEFSRLLGGHAAVPPDPISKLEDLPKGHLASHLDGEVPLSDDLRLEAAVLLVSPTNGTLLVSREHHGKALQFEVVRRATELGVTLRVVPATRDVISLVYSNAASGAAQADETEAEKLIANLVEDAWDKAASDIHIEARLTHADVLFRIDGSRVRQSNLSHETAVKIGQLLYNVAADSRGKGSSWKMKERQDARFTRVLSTGEQVSLRFSSMPISPAGGVAIVLRFIDREGDEVDLAKLGYTASRLSALDMAAVGSTGMVLMVGPTGSGKSTTLDGMITRIYEARSREIKVLTVQQPVERIHPRACQITLPEGAAGVKVLEGIVRQDPDVTMVGEIRDPFTMGVARDLALIGRKTLSTLHANSAMWAFVRLQEFGMPPALLRMPGFIAGICYQRLVPRLCPHCSIPFGTNDRIPGLRQRLKALTPAFETTFKLRGPGCGECNGSGSKGRVSVCDIVIPDEHLLDLVAGGRQREAEAYWRSGGANPGRDDGELTAIDQAIRLAREGLISPIEVELDIGRLIASGEGVAHA